MAQKVKSPRFTPAMYDGIERDSRVAVMAAVDYFRKGIPGFQREMAHDPAECQQCIDAIWTKLIGACKQHGIALPPEGEAAAKRLGVTA